MECSFCLNGSLQDVGKRRGAGCGRKSFVLFQQEVIGHEMFQLDCGVLRFHSPSIHDDETDHRNALLPVVQMKSQEQMGNMPLSNDDVNKSTNWQDGHVYMPPFPREGCHQPSTSTLLRSHPRWKF
jgi:hypothetical protein